MTSYEEKIERLRLLLRELESVAVAFSGGVDSSVLLHAAQAELGVRACGLIADSPSLPRRELADARALAREIGAELAVVQTQELEDARYRENRGDRCYFCKSALFAAMEQWARRAGFRALAYGEITDDLRDDRPGARAAGEFGVVAPLREAGLSKEDVRRYARAAGLPVADKPASACLASRIPVGTAVTAERLATVEIAERALHELGLRHLRVRLHDRTAHVELGGGELERARSLLGEIERRLRAIGFEEVLFARYVAPSER